MKLNFIKDKEANLEKNDLLGTKPYFNTLLQIIENASTPFTVGLFGGWGTGKSSIIKTIKNKFNDDNSSKVHVFVYDAWKYSRDPFRRTFLSQFKEELNIKGTSEFDSFYTDKNEEVKGKTGISDYWWLYLLIFVFPLILINLMPLWEGKEFEWTTFLISIFISGITVFISKTFVQYKISITKPRTFAPEQFENIFKESIESIVGKKGIWKYVKESLGLKKEIKKIVIIFDNIDRCHKDLAFELLLTVKNFLEQENVIFIIPIDETEIKKHIVNEGHDGNEFLRKLFNTTISIKMFSENDLFEFAKQLNKKHNINLSNDVISIISQEFSKNPRKIIQFINVLQTEILLAIEQEQLGNIKPKGIISNNIPFLTKITLVREEWGKLYAALKFNPFLLNEINNEIENSTPESTKLLNNEQYRFFARTKHITTKNIEAFFVNKDVFADVPDELNKFVISQDWESIRNSLAHNVWNIDFEKFLIFLDERFRKDVNKRKLLNTSGVNIISLIFKISNSEYRTEFLEYYYGNSKLFGKVNSLLNSSIISKLILSFDPKLLLDFTKTDLLINKKLLQEIITVIRIKDIDNYELLYQYIESFKDDEIKLKKVSSEFSNLLKIDPSSYNDFNEILETTSAINTLIKPTLIEEFIDSLEANPEAKYLKEKVDIIDKYNSFTGLSIKLLNQFFVKIIEFVNSTNDLETLEFWFHNLRFFYTNNIAAEPIFKLLNSKFQVLNNLFTSNDSEKNYISLLNHFLSLASDLFINNLLPANSNLIILSWLQNFFSRVENKTGLIISNKNYQKIIQKRKAFNWDFAQIIINKFNQLTEWEEKKDIAETLNSMLSLTTDDIGLNKTQIKTILTSYINNVGINVSAKKWLLEAINNPFVKLQLVEIIKELSIDRKLEAIAIIKELDSALLKECVEDILTGTNSDNFDEVYSKLMYNEIGKTVINSALEKVVKSLQIELKEQTNIKLLRISKIDSLPIKVSTAIVNKIKPFLSDDTKTKEEKIFALTILNNITIPNDKKPLIKELVKSLDTSDFNNEELVLYNKIKNRRK